MEVLLKLPLARPWPHSQAVGLKPVKPMKIHVEMEMTPEEARKLMGLPDVSRMQEELVAEMHERMKAALDTSDPEAMLKAWMPMGGAPFEQFQRFLWDSAQRAAGGTKKKT
jgi:Family of unknown function (DUF6489)